MNISILRKISIVGLGSVSTLLILLMVEVLGAQILTDFVIGHISNNVMLLIIITGLLLFTIIISVIVGILITKEIKRTSVLKASIISLLSLLLILFIVSNITLFINYRDIYSGIYGFQVLLVFPQVLMYFGIYILRDIFNLFIFVMIIYYMLFVAFLEGFYVKKYV
ncbi:hypothetical protein LCGC14_2265150 [marine sediment metagenome]|uniref:Uncharacterized protein n=1 Tax=marine sediment metagenome TaxID=412755 RepID=A0A0F9DKS6_9ZZZZ